MRHILLGGLCALTLACGGGQHGPPPTLVTDIEARDGVALSAAYFSPDKAGPGILLFHQCNMDRHAWDALAGDLKAGGFHVLAADRRGFGESGGQAASDQKTFDQDADALYEDLVSRPGVDRQRIAAAGASCGVDDALRLAARHDRVRSLVLLSGYANESMRTFIAKTPELAMFGAASRYDMGDDVEAIVRASSNPRSVVKVYPASWLGMITSRADHGVALFGSNPDLRTSIVQWLQQQLVPDSARFVKE